MKLASSSLLLFHVNLFSSEIFSQNYYYFSLVNMQLVVKAPRKARNTFCHFFCCSNWKPPPSSHSQSEFSLWSHSSKQIMKHERISNKSKLTWNFPFLLIRRALVIGKLALLLSGIIALKKLLEHKHSSSYEVVAHPTAHHGYSYDEHGQFRRSIDAAQKLAYAGQKAN